MAADNSEKFLKGKIPNIWIHAKIIAILKSGKDSVIRKSYGPISLLCYTYKLYDRMILNRIVPTVKQHLSKEHTGFRHGKSCTSQLLNFTQHIENRHQEAWTSFCCIQHSKPYRLLIQKLYNTTQDSAPYRVSRTCCLPKDYMWN